MSSITFIVTDSATDPDRLSTQQDFDIPLSGDIVLSEFTPPETVYDRSSVSAMDQRSSRGTLISKHRVSTIGLTYPISRKDDVQELVDSLADYQLAQFDGNDIDYFAKTQDFKMTSANVAPETQGCTHLSASIEVQWF